MFVPLLISYCHSLGASPSYAAFIASIYGFLQFFSGPIMGKFSDNVGRRFCLQMCFFFSFLTYFIVATSNSLTVLLLSRIPLGIFKHTQDLCKAYIADHFKSKRRTEVLGKFNSIVNMGFIFGPLLGSYILLFYDSERHGHGIDRLIFIAAVAFLVNFILTTALLDGITSTKQYHEKPSKLTYYQTIKSHLSVMSQNNLGYFWFILTLRFLLSYSVFSSRYDLSIDLRPKELSMVTAVGGIAASTSGLLVGFFSRIYRHQYVKMVLHLSIIQGLSIVGLTYCSGVTHLILFTIPMTFANAILKVSLTNMTLNFINHRSVGLVMGIATSTISLSRFLAPLIASLLNGVDPNGPGIIGFVSSFSASVFVLVKCNGVKKWN